MGHSRSRSGAKRRCDKSRSRSRRDKKSYSRSRRDRTSRSHSGHGGRKRSRSMLKARGRSPKRSQSTESSKSSRISTRSGSSARSILRQKPGRSFPIVVLESRDGLLPAPVMMLQNSDGMIHHEVEIVKVPWPTKPATPTVPLGSHPLAAPTKMQPSKGGFSDTPGMDHSLHRPSGPYAEVKVPQQLVTLLVGTRGTVVNSIQQIHGVRIKIRQETKALGYSVASISGGTPEAIALAEKAVKERVETGLEGHFWTPFGGSSGPYIPGRVGPSPHSARPRGGSPPGVPGALI